MLRHIGLAAAVAMLVAVSTQSLHARGGHRGGGFARGFTPSYFTPGFSSGSGMNSPTTSRRAARASKSYASTSTASPTSTSSTSSTNGSWSSRHASNASANSPTNTPTNATNTGLQTPAVGTTAVSPLGILPYTNSLDPNVSAQRTYGYLLRNARQLIQAGLYGPAANYLQRIIAGAPGTRIANEARQLLARLPVI
jgi:hypothetical protein